MKHINKYKPFNIINNYIKRIATKPLEKRNMKWFDISNHFINNHEKVIKKLIDDGDTYDLDDTPFKKLFPKINQYFKENNIIYKLDINDYESVYELDDLIYFDSTEFHKWLIDNDEFSFAGVNENFFYKCVNWLEDAPKSNGKKIIYRAISLPNNIDNYNGVGVYWSYNEKSAEAHWGNKDAESIVIIAEIEPDDISLDETLMKSVWHLNGEEEITVKSNWTIDIIGFKTMGEIIKLDEPITVKT